MPVVVVHNIQQSRKAPIVIKTAFLLRYHAGERRCSIPPVGRPIRLESIDSNFLRCVHVPAWLRVKRRDMARCAARFSAEQFLAIPDPAIERILLLCRSGDDELIRMKSGKLWR